MAKLTDFEVVYNIMNAYNFVFAAEWLHDHPRRNDIAGRLRRNWEEFDAYEKLSRR